MDKVLVTLSMAMHGHKIIALARLAGFRLPRNMRRPLEARTLAEFWNRYYYYFKELLVEFFFVPTFLRTFRKHPRLRMFFSTFMAAGVGNAIFHFLSDFRLVATLGWSSAVETFTSYLFYCAVLATGIGISQVRTSSGANPPTTRLGKLLAFLWVWTFVICLNVFGNETRVYSLDQRLSFMASVMGIN
jgi:D-alanyl-lipoteichoic acid acyltransferase DltB (MBOAT superfamily)